MTNVPGKSQDIANFVGADSDNFSTSDVYVVLYVQVVVVAVADSLMPLCWQILLAQSVELMLPLLLVLRHFSFFLMSVPSMFFIYFILFYLSWPVISRINSNAAPLFTVSFFPFFLFLFILAALFAIWAFAYFWPRFRPRQKQKLPCN